MGQSCPNLNSIRRSYLTCRCRAGWWCHSLTDEEFRHDCVVVGEVKLLWHLSKQGGKLGVQRAPCPPSDRNGEQEEKGREGEDPDPQ